MAFGVSDENALDGAIPGWAERAVHGDLSAMRSFERKSRLSSDSLQRLVQSQSVDQMLNVIATHRRSLQAAAEGLSGQNARVINELVGLEANRRARPEIEQETLLNNDPQSHANGRRTIQQTTLAGPKRYANAGQSSGGRASHLANQLLKLIHLAEVERRVDDAQKEVRMSQRAPGGDSTTGTDPASTEKQPVPDVNELFRAALEWVEQVKARDALRNLGNS